MKIHAFVAFLIIPLLVLSVSSSTPQENLLVIKDVRVVDGTGAPARKATVIIRGDRIESVSDNPAIPAGARVITATGQTLLPGLFDLHTHLPSSSISGISADFGKNLKAYLAAGVTTAVDFGSDPESFEPIRRLIKSGALASPRILLAARFSPPGGHGTESGNAGGYYPSTAEQAHAFMKEALQYKPDAIKAFTDGWRYGSSPDMNDFNEQTTAAIAEEAHAAGIKVFTHAVSLRNSKISAHAGIDVQGHGIGDLPADEDVIRIYKEKGTGYVSTLECYGHQERFARLGSIETPARLADLLEPAALPKASKSDVFARGVSAAGKASAVKRWEVLLQNIRLLHAAGIPIGTGTDSGVTGIHHGWAALQEVQHLVEGGLTPLEALHSATGVSAQLIGASDRGIIAPGKIADLLLVQGEPDVRIQDIENTRGVILGGVELDLTAIRNAIHSEKPTPVPARAVPALVYDGTDPDNRTSLGTRLNYTTERGIDHSTVIYTRILRANGNYALSALTAAGPKKDAFVRLRLPLTPGAIEPADVRAFRGVSFDVRGEGSYRLLLDTYGARDGELFQAPFSASGGWTTVKINFSELKRKAAVSAPWTGADVRELQFEIARGEGKKGWLELDNVSFY